MNLNPSIVSLRWELTVCLPVANTGLSTVDTAGGGDRLQIDMEQRLGGVMFLFVWHKLSSGWILRWKFGNIHDVFSSAADRGCFLSFTSNNPSIHPFPESISFSAEWLNVQSTCQSWGFNETCWVPHSTTTQADIMSVVPGLQACSTCLLLFLVGTFDLKPAAIQCSPNGCRFYHPEDRVWLWDCTRGRQQQKVGNLNLVFVTKYQVDSPDNRVWQCRIKRSWGVFIPCLLLLLSLSPSPTVPLVPSSLSEKLYYPVPDILFSVLISSLWQVRLRKWNTTSRPRMLEPKVSNWWVNTPSGPWLLAENQYAALSTPLKIKQCRSLVT